MIILWTSSILVTSRYLYTASPRMLWKIGPRQNHTMRIHYKYDLHSVVLPIYSIKLRSLYCTTSCLLYYRQKYPINCKHSYWVLSVSRLTLSRWPSGQGVGLVTWTLGVQISVGAHFFLHLLKIVFKPLGLTASSCVK